MAMSSWCQICNLIRGKFWGFKAIENYIVLKELFDFSDSRCCFKAIENYIVLKVQNDVKVLNESFKAIENYIVLKGAV